MCGGRKEENTRVATTIISEFFWDDYEFVRNEHTPCPLREGSLKIIAPTESSKIPSSEEGEGGVGKF